MKTRVKVEGFRELDRALDGLGTRFRRKKAAREALKKAAVIVQSAVQASVPVRSGRKTFGVGGTLVDTGGKRRVRVGGSSRQRTIGALRAHISIGTRLNRSQRRANKNKMPVEVYIGTRDRAGILTEFGTKDTPAQGWFRRAWGALSKRMLLDVIGREMWVEISKQARLRARAIKRGRQ